MSAMTFITHDLTWHVKTLRVLTCEELESLWTLVGVEACQGLQCKQQNNPLSLQQKQSHERRQVQNSIVTVDHCTLITSQDFD